MIILTDCDGVLVNWISGFSSWMRELGYEEQTESYDLGERFGISTDEAEFLCRFFNTSADIGWLPSLMDSVKYVKKLHEENGFSFHCITALGRNPCAQQLRRQNLGRLFGEAVFRDISFVDYGDSKSSYLYPYRNSDYIWVEDNVHHAEDGLALGLRVFLFNHPYNIKDSVSDGIVRVNSWKEIYDFIST